MPLEIPGYYFDAEKNKYFKIEKSQTAPSSAQWTSESVKRRKIQDEARDAEEKRAYSMRNHIKRSSLRKDIVASGLLARECEHSGVKGRMDEREYGAAVWARGVVDKGGVAFVPGTERRRRKFGPMRCFYVAGEESNTEVGVVYMTIEEEMVVGTYLETDENERIGLMDERTMARLGSVATYQAEMIRCPQMSSIKYHKPSHKVLITSSDADESCGLYMFSPPVATTIDDKKHWHIGETDHYQRIAIRPRSQPQSLIYKSTPAPSSSPLLCIIGTNAGLLSVSPNGSTASVASRPVFGGRGPKSDKEPGRSLTRISRWEIIMSFSRAGGDRSFG
ncbi:hypothetical protein PT974_00216 [Cladobotryum mycophilum]|uniref:Uncharacterized protein n=1 Tax=Cladobotryum mycophilum TaxID=491253 RepID=A0ABR0T0G8_9HYPO